MQGGGRGQGFGDPFGGFGGFSGFGGHGSLLSNFFGGRDPFDDPFFTRPFGGMLGGSPFASMFEPSLFGQGGSPFPAGHPAGFIEDRRPQPQPQPQPNKRRGPIIEEINSDDENKEDGDGGKKDGMPRKHSRFEKEPYIEVPDDDADEMKDKHAQFSNKINRMNNVPSHSHHMMNSIAAQPQSQCFTFQSSSVTYGGANGAYYTKSSTMRTGSDGLTFQEHKEADSTTGRAAHQISRGIHNKGHSLTRKLSSDGKVDSMQTLHNLNEDEISGFEEAWNGKAKKHLPGLSGRINGFDSYGSGSSGQTGRGGWALPSAAPVESPMVPQNGKRARSQMAANAIASHPQYHGPKNPQSGTQGRTRRT